MSMSIAEARAEIKSRFEQATAIERRYPDGLITNGEDDTQVKTLLTEVDALEEKLHALEEVELRKNRISNGLRDYSTPANGHVQPQGDADDEERKSVGQRFTDNAEYKGLLADGQFTNNRNIVQFAVPLGKTRLINEMMQRKTLITTGSGTGGPMIIPDYRPGVQALPLAPRTILDLISTAQTTSDLVEFIQVKAFTNAATSVAEATATTGTTGTKPESALSTQIVALPVVTIAHWMPVTNKMLADAPAIRGIIDQYLTVGLELQLEHQVLSGAGTGDDMTGILNSGIQVQATGADNDMDAIYKALVKVRINGLVQPTAIAMHPLNMQTIRLARGSLSSSFPGDYLMGPPSQAGATTLWGLPVYESLALTAGVALVGAWNLGGMLFEREGSQVRVGLINDQFVRNMQTILVEARAVWATFRPLSWCQITGLA